MDRVGLLSKKDILENNCPVIGDGSCEPTDFAVLCGVKTYRNDSENYYSPYFLSDIGSYDCPNGFYDSYTVFNLCYLNGLKRDILSTRNIERSYGIRPVIPIPEDMFVGDLSEIEYLDLQQKLCSIELNVELERLYTEGKLIKTGRVHSIYVTFSDGYDITAKKINYDEYEYKGRKFIRAYVYYRDPLADETSLEEIYGPEYEEREYAWVEVLPLKWIVNRENNTLISKYIIASGMAFTNKRRFKSLDDTIVYRYLRDLFMDSTVRREDVGRNIMEVNGDEMGSLSSQPNYLKRMLVK